jgi:hypothetical protein
MAGTGAEASPGSVNFLWQAWQSLLTRGRCAAWSKVTTGEKLITGL